MQHLRKPHLLLSIALSLSLVLAVACGTSAPAQESAAPADSAPAASSSSGTSSTAPSSGSGTSASAAPTAVPQAQAMAEPESTEVHPGKLNIMVGDLASERFDIAYVGGSPGGANYGRILHAMLISMTPQTEMIPGIAEDWDLSADGLTTTFTIREGAKFHDGSEIRPEDVLWTLRNSFGPQAHEHHTADSTAAAISRLTESIELSAPNQVSVTTQRPFVALAGNVSEIGDKWYGMMPEREGLYDEAAAEAYDLNPIAAGPMMLTEHVRASVMSFERFDDFYYQPANSFSEDKRVKFQSLDLHLVPEEATRVAAVRSGEADIVPASLDAQGQIEAGGGRLIFGQEGVYVLAKPLGCFDAQHPCNDKRVRQALDYAIDKELLRDTLYGEEVFVVKGWAIVTPNTYGYSPALDPRPFDPDKARELLAEAGYPDGEGLGPLIINTWPSTGMPYQVEAAQLVGDTWKRELNVDVEVRVSDSTGTKKRMAAGELDGQILWRENEARKNATIATSSGYGDPEREINKTHADPTIFSQIQGAMNVLDLEEREQAWKDVYTRLRDESYELGVGYVNIPWGVGPRVKTWEPYPFSLWISAVHTITLEE